MHSGQLRQLGVSNIYDPEELKWLINEARVKVSVVQNRWHEGNGWDWDSMLRMPAPAEGAVYDICQAHGIRYQ